jgi:hypothetical protein
MFASSLARTSMRALVLTMATLILTGFAITLAHWNDLKDTLLDQAFIVSAALGSHHFSFAALCLLLLLGVILGFSYLNYRRLEPPFDARFQIVIVSVVAGLIIGIPFFVAKAMDLEAQRLETGLSPRAYLAYRNNENPELVLKEVSAALDRPAVNGKNSVQGTVYTLFSNGYRDMPEAQAIMHRALTNADFQVRYAGINLLTEHLNNVDTNSAEYRLIITEFESALKDPHPNVRFIAARVLAMKGLDLEQSIAQLSENVSDVKASENHRRWVVDILRDIGPKAKSAVPALIQAVDLTTNGPDKQRMYNAVTNALTKIDPGALSQLKPLPPLETKAPTTVLPGLGVKP